MMKPGGLSSIRVRLTVWYTGVLAIALVLMALATYGLLRRLVVTRNARSLVETAHTILGAAPRGGRALAEAVSRFRAPDRRLILLSQDGRLIAASEPLRFGPPPAEEVFALAPDDPALLEAARRRRLRGGLVRPPGGGHAVRVVTRPARPRGRGGPLLVVVGTTRDQVFILERARRGLAVTGLIALLLAAVPGYVLARRALAPVAAMTRRAARIGAENLDERLPIANPRDELGELSAVLNDLLNRLQHAFDQQRRFMAEAAHELRTPVAVMRGEAELALSRVERSSVEYREALEVIESESRRLSRIVDDLLTLSRAEAGQYPLHRSLVHLEEVAADTVRSFRVLANDREMTLELHASQELPFEGDEDLLRRMLSNLVENALKHARRGDRVVVDAARADGRYRIRVADTGPGIPAKARERIFEPFFRGSPARAGSGASGAGLGLPIARWIAEAHGGELSLVASSSEGSEFEVVLPPPRGSVA